MTVSGFFRRIHPGIVLPMIVLTMLGLGFIYSTTATGSLSRLFVKQLIWSGVGLTAFVLLLRIGYRDLLAWSGWIYVITIVLLMAVLLIGKSRGVSQSWLALGGFSVQPSEFAKLAIVLLMARYLGHSTNQVGGWSMVAKGLGFVLVPVALVIAQPDLGTAMVFGPILLAMLWVAGAKGKYLIMLVAAVVVSMPLAFSGLKDYQKDRLLVFMNPDADPLGAGYNILQSKIAIGSGGFLGKGFGAGTQNRLAFLPEKHTDFIFSIVGEEVGWWGGMLVIALFLVIFTSALRIAERSPDMQAKLLVVGLATMLFSHVIINIGVSLGIMPVTGLPLPFVSYGGSSLVTCMVALALIVNVGSRRYGYHS